MTQLILKKGRGKPKTTDLALGEVAIDEERLTLYGKSAIGGAIARVGLSEFLATDGSNKMDAQLDMDGFSVVNVPLPTDIGDAANKQYVDMSMDWERISSTGFDCVPDQQYLVDIVGSNPYVNLPVFGNQDIGKFVVLADSGDNWNLPGRHLLVNLNGPLHGQAVGQLVLDIAHIIVTLIWDGYSWSVYSSMASTQPSSGGSPWVDTDQGIEYTGRIDTGEVHTHTLEAEYFLGTPRRHYEAIFGRAVPLNEELDSLEKRTVRHGADLERIERFIQDARAEETNNPVVHEAVYDDSIYGRQNGDWVKIPMGGTGDGHDIAAMFFWETRKTFGTEHEGTRWVKFNVAETNSPGNDLMLPDWSLVHQVELQLAWFKGKDPNTGVEYNPLITVQHLSFDNEVIKEDVLYKSEEFGWGQGFERDERMFQIRLERGAFKFRVDIMNADGNNMPTSADWQGTTYKNLIAVNGLYLTTDESQA